MSGCVEDIPADFDNPAALHHRDPFGDRLYGIEIMTYKYEADFFAPAQFTR